MGKAWSALALIVLACAENSCGDAQAGSDPYIMLKVETVKSSDSGGVATATCDRRAALVGGGCECKSASQHVFSAVPTAGSYLCACTKAPSGEDGATAYAKCLSGEGIRADVDVGTIEARDQMVRQLREMRLTAHPAVR